MPRAAAPILIGIDTGGTFTDFVWLERGRLRVDKRPSTPDDPARAVLEGVRALLAGRPASACDLTYGSTVATNAVLERRGARVALLTTAGFEDVLEIGRQTRPDLYALEPERPEPLVPRRRRRGVAERIGHTGEVLRRLTPAALRRARLAVQRSRAESVAICLLHAYANPAHERALGRALRRLGLDVTLSHELVAEYREYERTSTTVLNAYVAPVMRRHLATLAAGIGAARLRVMQSNGGAISIQRASREAVRTLLSGPAAGAIGALAAARRVGIRQIITCDMGGTSTDVSLLDGTARRQTEWCIGELPVQVPAIDVHTIGAGGGSIAHRDVGGALKVGPQSAGARPGPACYGRGTLPTVTDADLLLGRLVPDAFLGGRMRLDSDRAARALGRLARTLRLDLAAAAEGVIRVVNAGMERAIRRMSVERGHDPRAYTLVAFGGAAGMHAAELAAALEMRRVLVPLHPGLLSAWGAAIADLQRDYVQTVRLTDPEPPALRRRLAALVAEARRELHAEGALARAVRIQTWLDVRYAGQAYELQVPMTSGFRTAFHAAHRHRYGYADHERSLEVVNLRVIATAPARAPRTKTAVRAAPASPFVPHRVRWKGRWMAARRGDRAALRAGDRLKGPLVITEVSATTFVPPGWHAHCAASGDLLLERSATSA